MKIKFRLKLNKYIYILIYSYIKFTAENLHFKVENFYVVILTEPRGTKNLSHYIFWQKFSVLLFMYVIELHFAIYIWTASLKKEGTLFSTTIQIIYILWLLKSLTIININFEYDILLFHFLYKLLKDNQG